MITTHCIQAQKHEASGKKSNGEPDTSSSNRRPFYDMESKDEPDFIETNCHWRLCDKEFKTQDELVKVNTSALITISIIIEYQFNYVIRIFTSNVFIVVGKFLRKLLIIKYFYETI